MYYEINVDLNGKHFFATTGRSIYNVEELRQVYNVFKEKFPESEGYKISVVKYETIGSVIDEAEIK